MDKKKILMIVGALVVLGGVYKFVLAPKPPAGPVVKPHVEGVQLPIDKEFMVNLSGGKFAKVQVVLLLSEKDPAAAAESAAEGAAATGPTPLHPQNAVIRSVITNELTGLGENELLNKGKQEEILKKITKRLNKETDAKVLEVQFTDLSVA